MSEKALPISRDSAVCRNPWGCRDHPDMEMYGKPCPYCRIRELEEKVVEGLRENNLFRTALAEWIEAKRQDLSSTDKILFELLAAVTEVES